MPNISKLRDPRWWMKVARNGGLWNPDLERATAEFKSATAVLNEAAGEHIPRAKQAAAKLRRARRYARRPETVKRHESTARQVSREVAVALKPFVVAYKRAKEVLDALRGRFGLAPVS